MPRLSDLKPAGHIYCSGGHVTASMRIARAAEWLILLVAVGYLCGRGVPRAWKHLNTDFPNYYVTARLLRRGSATNRIYEWIWLQRQKDHMGIQASDQPLVGFVPDTPFSTLLMWPLSGVSPLAAKRLWISLNILLTAVVVWLMHSLTAMPWRRLAVLVGLNYSWLRNLENGQYYLVLLLIIALGLWCYVRNNRWTAGLLMGIGCGLKIFPGFYILYFARKKDLRAIIGVIAGTVLSVTASVLAFGLPLHRIYLAQVLPWALHGEALDPYNLTANSLSALLHKLFLFEPGWNPQPVIHSPLLCSVLHPLVQLVILAPAILLTKPNDRTPPTLQLEWSTLLVALLAISTLPSSYHFTLLILPVGILAALFLREHNGRSLVLLLMLYMAISFPAWHHVPEDGWWALLAVPRLYFVILLCLLFYITLVQRSNHEPEATHGTQLWVAAFSLLLLLQIVSTLHHLNRFEADSGSRIMTSANVLMATQPVSIKDKVGFIGMLPDGYFAGFVDRSGTHLGSGTADQLSQTALEGATWIEEAGVESHIVSVSSEGERIQREVNNAEFPVGSATGAWLAYVRSTKGTARVWVRSLAQGSIADRPFTPPQLDVEEMTFLPDGSLIFSAATKDGASKLYRVNEYGVVNLLGNETARYPAASPDGHWLAYSKLNGGVWNLWLQDLNSGSAHQLTDADCNDIAPAWQSDSKTLIYASDCGRALWFTALYRRKVVP